ncbi:hypothetical protein GCM10011507_22010 [Edaphobacter acidisoli]|uniref:Trm112 family protein n=1 Tax=Edaphobacter acidisoli TaxID=2040573 RepID=A0A916RT73_9BACT|nr:Trm112 family protein [Edaphobacter acidisoli]GGA70023.1 hypothetical protein GCM10011507_22010 [Edaphobacter acidisoli]
MEANVLKAKGLERLVCPVCHQQLGLADGGIRCMGCGRVYPSVDGIPVLIASRATGI